MSLHDLHNLPAEAARDLLIGAASAPICLGLAETCVAAANDGLAPAEGRRLLRISLEMMRLAWEHDPFSAETASAFLGFQRQLSSIAAHPSPALQQAAQRIAGAFQPADSDPYETLQTEDRIEEVETLMDAKLRAEPDNPLWKQRAFTHALYRHRLGWLDETTSRLPADQPEDMLRRADLNLLLGRFDAAAAAYAKGLRELPSSVHACRAAHAAELIGDEKSACDSLRSAMELSPHSIGPALRLHDLLAGTRTGAAMPDGSMVILIYTFNKADLLDKTLSSVVRSDIGQAHIIALNNGCTDHTASVMRKWRDSLGDERMSMVDLPVNVGAPAARNWLRSLPQTRRSDWTVYLDDDVELPVDWAAKLGHAAKMYPMAGVWGCKAVYEHPPTLVQSADVQMRALQGDAGGRPILGFSEHYIRMPDDGALDYLRPCAHAMGCCHMFKTERLMEGPDFDIRFSPSQADDLDRDLQIALRGEPAVYNGFLTVKHKMSTGLNIVEQPAKKANLQANYDKMRAKYQAEDVRRLAEEMRRTLQDDLKAKLLRIQEQLPIGC